MIEVPLGLGSAGHVQRIHGFYLYTTGHEIHPVGSIGEGTPYADALRTMFFAQAALNAFIDQSIFRLQTSREAAGSLLVILDRLTSNFQREEPITVYEAYELSEGLKAFETILNAEFAMMNVYLVLKKRGYDTTDLVHNGYVLFPPDLPLKVPDAVSDINAGTKCIAFELPTAAGFHLHRANETVLRAYFDAVSRGALAPAVPTMGAYIKELERLKLGTPTVRSALKDLKDLHRNPLIHPDQSLDSVDDAIALLGSIHAVVVPMLKAIPDPSAVVAAIGPPTP